MAFKLGAAVTDLPTTLPTIVAGIAAILKMFGIDIDVPIPGIEGGVTLMTCIIGVAIGVLGIFSNSKSKVAALLLFAMCAFAAPAQAEITMPADPPTDAQVLKWFPNAKTIDAVSTYLFRTQSLAVGTSYTIAKYKDLINGDIQLAAVAKGGSYAGVGLSVDSADVWKALGKAQPDFMRNFPIFFGVTAGYVWTNTERAVTPGWDGGIRAKVPVNIEPLLSAVGIN